MEVLKRCKIIFAIITFKFYFIFYLFLFIHSFIYFLFFHFWGLSGDTFLNFLRLFWDFFYLFWDFFGGLLGTFLRLLTFLVIFVFFGDFF